MKFVYLIQSLAVPNQRYIGITADLDERLRTHNSGGSYHTSKYRPWKIVPHLCFQDEQRAVEFERHLKSGSDTPLRKSVSGKLLSPSTSRN
jgi:putative endonuclease